VCRRHCLADATPRSEGHWLVRVWWHERRAVRICVETHFCWPLSYIFHRDADLYLHIAQASSLATTEIERLGGQYALKGDLRSLILVPIESLYGILISEWYKLISYLAPFPNHRTVLVRSAHLFNAIVFSSLCGYRHKSYIAIN